MISTTAVSVTNTIDSTGAANVTSGPSIPIHHRSAATSIAPVEIALNNR
jgi:hypothetical protein